MGYRGFVISALMGLSQLGVSAPQETLDRAKHGQAIRPTIHHAEGELPVEVMPADFTVRDIPASLQAVYAGDMTNALLEDPSVFTGVIDLAPLGPYEPNKGHVFYVPYIPIPEDEFVENLKGINLSEEMKSAIFFKLDGKSYARYFLHPSRTSSYQELIDKYGIVRDEFLGFLSGSPRSIYVWDPKDPNIKPFQAKTSLHFLVNDDLKINNPSKIARSYLVNSIFAEISPEDRKTYAFSYFPESLQLMPSDVWAGTIYREIPSEMLRVDGNKYVPGYYLTSPRHIRGREYPPLLLKLVDGQRDKIGAAAEILRPLLRLSAFLMFREGLKGEMHEQNIYFELSSDGEPTGRLYVKDMDSFRVDVELRLRQGKAVTGLEDIYKPFVYSKFAKASGFSPTDKTPFDQDAFDSYIEHTFGFAFCKVLDCTKSQKRRMYERLNLIMAEEVSAVTGLVIDPRFVKSNNSWLNNIDEQYRLKLSGKIKYESIPVQMLDPKNQAILKREYLRLRALKRSSATLGSLQSEGTYFVLTGNVIEARYLNESRGVDKAVGFVALEPEDSEATLAFYAEVQKKNDARDTFTRAVSCEVLLKKAN